MLPINTNPINHIGKGGKNVKDNKYTEFTKEQPLFHVKDVKFPLSTKDMKIVDKKGRRVKLVGTNWSGAHLIRHVVSGLEYRGLREIALEIRDKFHMNCIRLTYSLQMFFDNNVVDPKYIKANPDLEGKTVMQIFDHTIQVLTEVGLMVILNNHTSSSMWCCSECDGDGLWWSEKYPENMFFQCAEKFALRYKHNPLVIGMDLRNQIRPTQKFKPTWGTGDPKTDWKRAAEKVGEMVLKHAPHWLIMVGGLDFQGDFLAVAHSPLKIASMHKLVYTGHLYSWSWNKYGVNMNNIDYNQFRQRFFDTQTYVRGMGIPFMLGEFGDNSNSNYWNHLVKYLEESDIDWTYWCVDGYKYDGTSDKEVDETYGIYNADFSDCRKKFQGDNMFNDLVKCGIPKSALK